MMSFDFFPNCICYLCSCGADSSHVFLSSSLIGNCEVSLQCRNIIWNNIWKKKTKASLHVEFKNNWITTVRESKAIQVNSTYKCVECALKGINVMCSLGNWVQINWYIHRLYFLEECRYYIKTRNLYSKVNQKNIGYY